MLKRIFLCLSFLAALTASSIAQNTNYKGPAAVRVTIGTADSDPWGLFADDDEVVAKSGVRASVAVGAKSGPMTPVATGARSAARTPMIVNAKSVVRPSTVRSMASIEQAAFTLINQKRAEKGLKPVIWDDSLAAVARVHSQNMAEFSFFSHRGLDNKLVSDRADSQKLGRWRAIGENIAYNGGYADPVERAVEQWLNWSSHGHNMLDDSWKESAVGVALAADGAYYFTQVFLKRR